MDLSAVVNARREHAAPLGWCSIFVKALALVAERRLELRRIYMPLPVPQLYEHPFSVRSSSSNGRFKAKTQSSRRRTSSRRRCGSM